VRFICGTQDIHKELESKLADFLGTEDTILFAAAFDANGGLFEPLFNEEDAIISDSAEPRLDHRRRAAVQGQTLPLRQQRHGRPGDAAEGGPEAKGARHHHRHRRRLLDGWHIAKLDEICDLADKYDALVMVDDCHATGFLGPKGAAAPTSTARREASTSSPARSARRWAAPWAASSRAARKSVVDCCASAPRPYLFSNALAPAICGASMACHPIAQGSPRATPAAHQLSENANRFREKMTAAGFDLLPGEHPIMPVMLYDAKLAQEFAAKMLELGVYVIGFYFPVVPAGQARIRTQMSAAHTFEHIDQTVAAFKQAGTELGVI
jgi:glycine C-acetyltransferase